MTLDRPRLTDYWQLPIGNAAATKQEFKLNDKCAVKVDCTNIANTTTAVVPEQSYYWTAEFRIRKDQTANIECPFMLYEQKGLSIVNFRGYHVL